MPNMMSLEPILLDAGRYLTKQQVAAQFRPPRRSKFRSVTAAPEVAAGALVIPPGRYFTKAQIARLRGVTVGAADRWIRFGYLPAFRAGGIGWLIEAQTFAAFTPPKPGTRPRNSTLPRLPEAEHRKYLERKKAFEEAIEAMRKAQRNGERGKV